MSANRTRGLHNACPHCGTDAGEWCEHLARKACGHVGECNCGKPCACGRPGCVIPQGKRRDAKTSSPACRQAVYEAKHRADTMTVTQAVVQEDGFWSAVSGRGRPTLAMGGHKRQKPSAKRQEASG